MLRIICPECNNNNDFSDSDHRPVECAYCFCTFDAASPTVELDDVQAGVVNGIRLIYQQTSAEIIIETDYSVIGRENTGADILRKILYCGSPVISRKHCSLTLINGEYWLKDEGSSNGTFAGIEKQNCTTPQKLSDGTIVYLGREAFMVKLIYQSKPAFTGETKAAPETVQIDEATKEKTSENTSRKVKKYRCNEGCGFETETYVEMCPKCYTCGSLVEITS